MLGFKFDQMMQLCATYLFSNFLFYFQPFTTHHPRVFAENKNNSHSFRVPLQACFSLLSLDLQSLLNTVSRLISIC